MPDETAESKSPKHTKKQTALFIIGLAAMLAGVGILGFFAVRKAVRWFRKQQLMRENYVVEIPAIGLQAPVLEGDRKSVV